MTQAEDPVLTRRERVRTVVNAALWGGAIAYVLTIVLFVVAVVGSFSQPVTALMTGLLILGSVLLAPAMVFHYALKAADRADREGSW